MKLKTPQSQRPPVPQSRSGVAKRLVIGRAMPSSRMEHTLLPKFLALPVFSSDPLSSVAYATEQAMAVLVAASLAARTLVIPIAIAISLVMVIVITSYRQTVRAYPTAAGSYVVSKDNLGTLAGLVAAAALLIDYVLTVAVSVVAGVLAITSAAPHLAPYNVELSVLSVVLIAIANLRGVRESGLLFAIPTYGFVVSIFALIAVGMAKCVGGCPQVVVPSPLPVGVGAVSIFVILHAFSSGSTALTGIEAISNGVSAFRRPQGKNAASTLTVMGTIAITAFLGVSYLSVHMGARPSSTVSVISEIARSVFPGSSAGNGGLMFYVVQGFTFAILILAANTSFQDFPRLSAILARDRFFPRQFENLGDRLVFSNGVVVLGVISCALIAAFDANVDKLIQLYVVGVFTAFTLSQAGMVHHWLKAGREGKGNARGWRRRMAINGLGAVATGIVTLVVIYTKFGHGAWIVIIAVPVLVWLFYAVSRHYQHVGKQLRAADLRPADTVTNTVLVYVGALDAATARAVGYVRSFKGDHFRAVHVGRPGDPVDLPAQWRAFSRTPVELELLPAGRSPVQTVAEHVRTLVARDAGFVTVVIPEVLRTRSLLSAFRQGSSFRLKLRLLREPGVAVTSVPMVERTPRSGADGDAAESRPLIPQTVEALVFVSGVHDGTVRAVDYARSLRVRDVRAVFVALDPSQVRPVWDEWLERRIPVQLDIVEAPFRELNGPVLEEVRRITSKAGALAVVVVPEFVVPKWRHFPLHNQKALFLKRLLLFEPNVMLASVPYPLS